MLFDRSKVTTAGGLVTKLGLTSALALGLAAAVGSVPAQAADAAVTVTPSTGLVDGQTVSVDATGLTPNSGQDLGECTLTPAQEAACTSLGSTTSDASGSASASVTVHKTFDAYVGTTFYGTVDCAAVDFCFIGISDTGNSGGNGAGAIISFQ